MDLKEEVIVALQNFIMERESANKRRIYYKEEKNEFNLSLTQFHIIDIIDKYDNVNNKVLVEKLGISPPGVTKAIRKLVGLNLIGESQSDLNRREKFYYLTTRGEVYANVHDQLHKQARKRYIELLSEYDNNELKTLISFFEKITDSLRKS
ncbi:MarR family winged helix-turn-helix transcriptional regulator [Staphylococcus simulans]